MLVHTASPSIASPSTQFQACAHKIKGPVAPLHALHSMKTPGMQRASVQFICVVGPTSVPPAQALPLRQYRQHAAQLMNRRHMRLNVRLTAVLLASKPLTTKARQYPITKTVHQFILLRVPLRCGATATAWAGGASAKMRTKHRRIASALQQHRPGSTREKIQGQKALLESLIVNRQGNPSPILIE